MYAKKKISFFHVQVIQNIRKYYNYVKVFFYAKFNKLEN